MKMKTSPREAALFQTGAGLAGVPRVAEKIGEGGCGVVYVAEQTEPVRRRVALRVLKLGMATPEDALATVVWRRQHVVPHHP
jgi:hypothetical protein